MDAKDLRIETALGERNDGSKYSQSGVALQCNRNKPYQDIGSNSLAKAEVAVRPCAVIGPDRVVPPPASNDAYLKKAVDLWPCSEYPSKPLTNVNPSRNISPRQTFQENMQRIMVPPTYSAVKHTEESNLNHVHDRNAVLPKNKQTMAPEAKYCDVPYTVNLLTNEHKNVREAEMCAPSVNSPLPRGAPHGWPPSGANLHVPPRPYGPHDVYQYPQYPSCAGPRPSAVPMARPHRTFQEEGSYVYPDSYYQDGSVRFKPYPSMKERYPQARYDYISSYPSPFHPPPPYAPHKYDIPNARPPQPYPVYSHLKYLENRVPDPNIEGYQRPNQQTLNYNMQFRNQIIHPPYAPVLGNTQNKLPSYPPDKSANKLSLDTNKAYIDYENAKAKYSLPDNYFVSEMARVHQVQKQVAMPNYASAGMQPVALPQYHRKDHMAMKNYEYMPHYRHFEHPLGFNHSGHHPPQFSPSTLAISPTDSNTSNDTANTQGTAQEDCGYVSQTSTTSARSVDRLYQDYHRRYDYRYRPIIGNSQMLPKPEVASSNSKDNNKIDVRQFLSMWNEGDEDNTNSNTKEITLPNNYKSQESAKSQDQLYVLGLVNVSSEELAKYEHIQKVSKLPENIKGYNSIELLNQFEEVIESSNINSFKTSTTKDFMPMKDRRNNIKQIVEVLPRPVSPLDVESKISQSVIHKEVGCNFEIKPCSPKMLNVEIAAPVQNILGERAIEKVSNPLSNKAKSPLSMRIDGKTTCNKTQRQESTHSTYENVSCKMSNSPFSANRMESVKTNYILQDLETNSGVCLASLPRLDNEIELNFPEVNQQFINANKGSHNLIENYSEEVKEMSDEKSSVADNDENYNNSTKQTNVSPDETVKEHSKLSKFRITKVNNVEYSEDESSANAIRTDSVIIENPENVRKNEDNKEKRSFGKEKDKPMNLTSQNSPILETESGPAVECALDFSLNKSETSLPLLNTYDDEFINTTQKDVLMDNIVSYDANNYIKERSSSPLKSPCERASIEPNTNSIIVRNNQSATTDYTFNLTEDPAPLLEENYNSPQSSIESCINENLQKLADVNDDNTSIEFDHKKISTAKASSTNVIVKHRHKIKTKSSKTKNDGIQCNSDEEPITKKTKEDCSFFDKNLNHNLESDSNGSKQISIITKSVIQSSDDRLKESPVLDNFKDENTETYVDNNIVSQSGCAIGKNDILVQEHISFGVSLNKKSIDHCSKINNENPDSEEHSLTKIFSMDIDDGKEESCDTHDDKIEISESTSDINQINNNCNNLVIESEISTDKTYYDSTLEQSPSVSFSNKVITSGDVMEIHSISDDMPTSQNMAEAKNIIHNSTNAQVHEIAIYEPNTNSTLNKSERESESLVSENKQGVNNERNSYAFEREITNKCNDEKTNHSDTSSADETQAAHIGNSSAITYDVRKQHNVDATLNVDKKYRTDSGYQSNKSSFNENDESIFGYPGNQTDDSVFMDQELVSQITSSDVKINNIKGENKPIFSQKSTATASLIKVVNDLGNEKINSEKFNEPDLKIENIALDDIDANMEIIFAQPNKDTVSECAINRDLQTVEVLNTSDKTEVDTCAFNIETTEKVSADSVDTPSIELKVMEEACKVNFKKLEESVESIPFPYNKKYSCHGKELHSPWIQKLMMFNVGRTSTHIFAHTDGSKIKKSEVDSPIQSKNIDVDDAMQNFNSGTSLQNNLSHSVVPSKDFESPDYLQINMNDAISMKHAKVPKIYIDSIKQPKDSIIDSTETVKGNEDINDIEIETNNIGHQSPKTLSVDSDEIIDNFTKKSLLFQTTTMKNDDCLLKSPQDSTVADVGRVLQIENVDNTNINNASINQNAVINSLDTQVLVVDNVIEKDTLYDSILTESESIQGSSLKVDIENGSETNTNSSDRPIDFSDNISINSNEEKIVEINKSGCYTYRENKGECSDILDKNKDRDCSNVEFSSNISMNLSNDLAVSNNNENIVGICEDEAINHKDKKTDFDDICVKYSHIDCSNEETSFNTSMNINDKIDVDYNQEKDVEINEHEASTQRDNKTESTDICVENNDIDCSSGDFPSNISINFNEQIGNSSDPEEINKDNDKDPTNSIISQITEDTIQNTDLILELNLDNNDKVDTTFKTIEKPVSIVNHLRPLKRSFSDSALNGDAAERLSDSHYSWPPKRNRVNDLENYSLNNRRSSINVEENVSFCILIDDNCIITDENEEKICLAELQEEYVSEIDTGNNGENSDLVSVLESSTQEIDDDYSAAVVMDCENEHPDPDSWVDDIACAEEVFSDEVAENVVISAPSSPTDSTSEYEQDEVDIYGCTTSSHTNEINSLHEDKMSDDDAQIGETYMTPHMNTMNKTLLYGDKSVESDNDQENIIIESDDWKPSPTHTPDYIDPTNVSSDFHLETPENKENVFVKDLSPLRRIDDYLDSSSAENETDDHTTSHHAQILEKSTQDETVYSSDSNDSSLDNVFDYKLKNESISTNTPSSSSSSPEVSSTTSEEKNSGILLKITNLNGSRVSQINEIQINNRPRCKFTEKKGYSTSNLNFPNRPLMTKAAQKYIPPIKESIRDLKVKITLPQHSLLKLKQLKLSRNEPKVHKQQSTIPRIIKKPKPNFDDVLKSIDEIQIKRHKEKSKKSKTVVPKVLIKKNENGSHYASTPKKEPIFSPDLTGRKWQPWVFLEKNNFIDKMAIENKTKAIFSHRKKTYVLAEKFKKYKSVNSAKFVISQPKTPGQLKYTIRLKHSI